MKVSVLPGSTNPLKLKGVWIRAGVQIDLNRRGLVATGVACQHDRLKGKGSRAGQRDSVAFAPNAVDGRV